MKRSKYHTSFCSYSGTILQKTNQFANFKALGKAAIIPSIHPLLQTSLSNLIDYGTFKHPTKLTATERHILIVAILYKSDLIDIQFPITDKTISPAESLEIFEDIIEFAIIFGAYYHEWKNFKSKLPLLKITKENYNTIQIGTWFQEIILPAARQLVTKTNINNISIGPQESKKDAIELEAELRADLDAWKAKRKNNKYKKELGHWALNQLEKNTGRISPMKRKELSYFLNAKPEKIKNIKGLAEFRNILKEILPISDQHRTNTLLVLRHLDSKIEYHNNIATIFGGTIEYIEAPLPDNIGISYKIINVIPDQNSNIEPKHEISKNQVLKNPALATLAALNRKELQEA